MAVVQHLVVVLLLEVHQHLGVHLHLGVPQVLGALRDQAVVQVLDLLHFPVPLGVPRQDQHLEVLAGL